MRIFNWLSNIFKKYQVVNNRISDKMTLKQTIVTVLQSLLISVLLLLIPSLLVANFWIIPELEVFLRIIVILIVGSFIYTYFTFYYYLIKINYLDESYNLKLMKWVEMIITLIFLMPLATALMFA